VGLLPGGRECPVNRLEARESFPFRPRPIPKQHPFQRDAANPSIPRPQDDQTRGIRRDVLALGPLLYGGCRHRLSELGGELPISQ